MEVLTQKFDFQSLHTALVEHTLDTILVVAAIGIFRNPNCKKKNCR